MLQEGLDVAPYPLPPPSRHTPSTIPPHPPPPRAPPPTQDERLRRAAGMLQEGLNAPNLEAEEAAWTRIIDEFSGLDDPWVPDVVRP
jgi:hypothetical protein